jgi:hypothetical protein
MRRKVEIKCAQCGIIKKVLPADLRRGAKYCSIRCSAQAHSLPLIKMNCIQCNKEFELRHSYFKRGSNNCSQKCAVLTRRRHDDPDYLYKLYEDRVIKKEGCWGWRGMIKATGYGEIKFNHQYLRAHRVSWEYHNGKILDNLYVLHHCDNRICTNPAHLFLGTARDNADDMKSKGRQPKQIGESNSCAKITENEARTIKIMLKENKKVSEIVKIMGITRGIIKKIKLGANWKHVKIEV